MDEPLFFALPDSVFVAFDAEPAVASRRGARHAIDAADYAAFFRRYGVDIREADASDVRSLGDLLSTLSWADAEATMVPHPADADELADLTRLFLAYGAAGAGLEPDGGAGTFLDDDGLRATARRTADGCDSCTAAAVDQVGGTYYEICNPHRRALYRRAVERETETEPDLDTIDVADCVDRLETDDDPTVPWTEFVPEESAIRGFHSVTLWEADPQPTEDLLVLMGFEEVGTEEAEGDTPDDERTRFAAAGPVGKYVDVLPTVQGGRQGLGTVHHVAFQTPTDEDQESMRKAVRSQGLRPTQQIDRHWFRSVYFREHGGVLFELATSDPGYDSDEPMDDLGGRLVLPGTFADRREEIEAGLTDVTIPRAETAEADD